MSSDQLTTHFLTAVLLVLSNLTLAALSAALAVLAVNPADRWNIGVGCAAVAIAGFAIGWRQMGVRVRLRGASGQPLLDRTGNPLLGFGAIVGIALAPVVADHSAFWFVLVGIFCWGAGMVGRVAPHLREPRR